MKYILKYLIAFSVFLALNSFGQECNETNLRTEIDTYETINLGGLMWMKLDFSAIAGRYLDNWNEAILWKDKINSSGKTKYSDWRVPTIKEYRKINNSKRDRIEYQLNFIELSKCNFWGAGPYAYWSSNEKGKYLDLASHISFKTGFATSSRKEGVMSNTASKYKGKKFGVSVRLVRDGK